MKVLFAFISILVSTTSLPVFADTFSVNQFCRQAIANYAEKKFDDADLQILFAQGLATERHMALPAWCQKHYRQIRLGGLITSLRVFDKGYAEKDWNAAFIRIPIIDTTVTELGVKLTNVHVAKRVVVNTKDEEIRVRIMALRNAVVHIRSKIEP